MATAIVGGCYEVKLTVGFGLAARITNSGILLRRRHSV
jgi:hypothetical protein